MNGQAYPLKLVQTKFGGMKIDFMNNRFEFYFNKNGIQYWRCINHSSTNCKAVLLSQANKCYVKDNNHNHESTLEKNDDNGKALESSLSPLSVLPIDKIREQMKKKLQHALKQKIKKS